MDSCGHLVIDTKIPGPAKSEVIVCSPGELLIPLTLVTLSALHDTTCKELWECLFPHASIAWRSDCLQWWRRPRLCYGELSPRFQFLLPLSILCWAHLWGCNIASRESAKRISYVHGTIHVLIGFNQLANLLALIILGCSANTTHDRIGSELMTPEDYTVAWYPVESLLNVASPLTITFTSLIGLSWRDNTLNNFENIDIWEIWLLRPWNHVTCSTFECCVIVEFDYVVHSQQFNHHITSYGCFVSDANWNACNCFWYTIWK